MTTGLVGGVADGMALVQARMASIQARFVPVRPPMADALGAPKPADFQGVLAGYLNADTSAAASGATDLGARAVALATQQLGVPYVWGGEDPSGFDCSGLVQHTFKQLGIDLPRTSDDQMRKGQAVSSLAEAQPGDLVFFSGKVTHVGIYMGDGQMIDAPHSGAKVRIEKVWGTPVAIRRITAPGAPALTGSGLGGSLAALGRGAPLAPSVAGGSNGSYNDLFAGAAQRYGVPANLLGAVARVESGLNPRAQSPAGAQGLMQLMPATSRSLGVDAFDPAQAVDGAARLLAGHLKRFGSTELALAAYNAGGGAVSRYGGIPPYPETQNYVRKVLATADQLGGLR